MNAHLPGKTTSEQHLDKADANETFVLGLGLKNQAEIDWAITALFYCALHHVQAYFVKMGGDVPFRHAHRDRAIRRDKKLKPIYRNYLRLKDRSRIVRYDLLPIFDKEEVAKMWEVLTRIKSVVKDALP